LYSKYHYRPFPIVFIPTLKFLVSFVVAHVLLATPFLQCFFLREKCKFLVVRRCWKHIFKHSHANKYPAFDLLRELKDPPYIWAHRHLALLVLYYRTCRVERLISGKGKAAIIRCSTLTMFDCIPSAVGGSTKEVAFAKNVR